MASVLSDSARAALVADLQRLLGDRCTTNPTQIDHHSHGESWHAPAPPDVVVFTAGTEEVSAVVQAAARHGAPVVPFGVGSGLEGHVNAVRGDRKSTRLNSSHSQISYAVFCLKKKKNNIYLPNSNIHYNVTP